MAKGIPLFFLILSIFIISIIGVAAETATYSGAFEAPICTSGNYTSGTPCSSGTLLNGYWSYSESNYPNSVDECHDHTMGFGDAYSHEQLVAWDTDNDGVLETGDTIQIQYDGKCNGNLWLSLWYSLNPEDGDSATWTLIDRVEYDANQACDAPNYDETRTTSGFTLRNFTISGNPTYVAVRFLNQGDNGVVPSDGCAGGAAPLDVDDLILTMTPPPTPQNITSISATNINKNNVTLESIWTYEEATWVDAYWVVDGVNQSKTNYTSTTGQISYDSFEATFGNWTAVSGALTTSTTQASCDTYSAKFGKEGIMTQTVDATGLDSIIIDFDVIPIGADPSDCLYLYCDNIEYKSYGIDCDQSFAGGWESFSETLTPSDCNAFDNSVELKFYSYFAGGPTEFFYVDCMEVKNFTGTSHDEVITGLDWETEYTYSLCTDSDIETICTSNSTFTTLNRTNPYINIAAAFDINQTSISVGGTFFFEDFLNITAYVVLDGTNQTQTLYESGTSQYHYEEFTGLDHNTNYTWDFCISYEDGIICEGGDTESTLDYTPPSINVIAAFDITNHETTLGGTVLYNDYQNFNLGWYLNDSLIATQDFEQIDEFDTSAYFAFNITELDYNTTYDYELRVRYQSQDYALQNVTTCEMMTQNYKCNGSSTNDYGWVIDVEITPQENADMCGDYCEQDTENTCCTWRNFGCYAYDGDKYYFESNDDWASNCTTAEDTVGTILYLNETDNFTTLTAYIPFISISGVNDLSGDTATLTGTHYSYDYPSTIPFFTLNGVELIPQYNYTHDYTTPHTETYDLTSLATNTTYNYTFCVGYGLGWALRVCDSTKNFTTGFLPTVTFGSPTFVNANDVTLHWTIDYSGTTNVEYRFLDNAGPWIPATDGVVKNWVWENLTAETNYTYYLQIQYDTLGDTFTFNTSDQYVTTYYENAMDDIWDTLLQGSSFAKILLGFVVLLGIIFFGASAFGKYNIQLGTYGFLILAIIGTTIATLMKLFTIGILLLVFIGAILLVVLKNMFFNEEAR